MSASPQQQQTAMSGSDEYDDSAQGSEVGSTGNDVDETPLSREARGLSSSVGWLEASQRQPTARARTRGNVTSISGQLAENVNNSTIFDSTATEARGILLGRTPSDTRSDGGEKDTDIILQLSDKEDAVKWVIDRLNEYNLHGWDGVDTSILDSPDIGSHDWHGALSAFVAHFSNRRHQHGVKVDFLAHLMSLLTVGTISAYANEVGSDTRSLSGKWRAIGGSIGRFVKHYSGGTTPKRTGTSGDYVTFARENYGFRAMRRMLRPSHATLNRDVVSAESSDDAQDWANEDGPADEHSVRATPTASRNLGRVREQGARRLASDHLRNQDARIQGLEASLSRLEQTAGSAIERIERAVHTLSLSRDLGPSMARSPRLRGEDPFGATAGAPMPTADDVLDEGRHRTAGVFSVLDQGPRGLAAAVQGGQLLSDELAAATNTHQLRQALGEYGEVTSSLPRLTRARHMKMLKFGAGIELLDAAAFRIGHSRSDRFVALADQVYHDVSSSSESPKERKAKVKHLYKDMRRTGAVLDGLLAFVTEGDEYAMARWRPFEIAARNYVFSWEQLTGNLTADAAEELLYSPVSLTRGLLSSAVKDLYNRRAKAGMAKDP